MRVIDSRALLVTLPPKPENFDRRLADIAMHGDKPLFRCVDGQRELKWRNGRMDVKHLLQSDKMPCYAAVLTVLYRRKNIKTGEYKIYSSFEAAKRDKDKHLSIDIEQGQIVETRAIGRPCWVIEVYVAPEEIDYDAWQANRFQYLEKHGVSQRIDVLGEFPRDGWYIACFDVLDEQGNACSPSDKTLDECRKRLKMVEADTKTIEQVLRESDERRDLFEQKQLERLNEQVFDYFGIAAKTRAHAGVVGKPILTVKQ